MVLKAADPIGVQLTNQGAWHSQTTLLQDPGLHELFGWIAAQFMQPCRGRSRSDAGDHPRVPGGQAGTSQHQLLEGSIGKPHLERAAAKTRQHTDAVGKHKGIIGAEVKQGVLAR